MILTHRKDLIDQIRQHYLGKFSDFLVIAYNSSTVDVSDFTESENFKLVPYYGNGEKIGKPGNLAARQWAVWPEVSKLYPEIETWIIHDYDLLCRVADSDLASRVGADEFGIIGKPFKMWQPGMSDGNLDIYPFLNIEYKKLTKIFSSVNEQVYSVLIENYSVNEGLIKTIYMGYGDILVVHAGTLQLLNDPILKQIEVGGIEHVFHNVFLKNNLRPIDLRKYYSMKILLEWIHINFNNKYEISHPIKYWPKGEGESAVGFLKNKLKLLLKSGKGVSLPNKLINK